MNIAAITITYNDGYKFQEWVEYYQEYKKELYLHIVVDNGSEESYIAQLKSTFTESVIIERGKNGGCTYAYNDGIRRALSDKNVDAIMLIGNDIKLSHGGVGKLCDFLYSNDTYGMVEPIILRKDSNIVEDFGCSISRFLIMRPFALGVDMKELKQDFRLVEAVTGGMNLSRRSFYEEVGIQDELLFMYSDEVDMGLRANKKGFKLAVTRSSVAWHQHINIDNSSRRMFYTSYLIGRNKVYLARKHYGGYRQLEQMSYHLFLFLGGLIMNIGNKENMNHLLFFMKGSWSGFVGNMRLNHIVKDSQE